jgi:hypothetical protein
MTRTRAAAIAERLDAYAWTYETAVFDCLGFEFSVRTTDPTLGRLLDTIYGDCSRLASGTGARYTVRERSGNDGSRFVVHRDGERVISTPFASVALDFLVWDVNQRTVATGTDHLLVHAGAAACDDTVVLVPGVSGAGKSTLVAALVRAGFGYITDEAIAIHPTTARVTGAPKPIGMKTGSWQLFPHALTAGSQVATRYTATTRHLPVTAFSGRVSREPLPARLIVVPVWDANTVDVASPLSRAHTLALMAEQSFNFETFGPARLGLLARLVTDCACYQLDTSDLDRAVDAIRSLLSPEITT